MSLTCRLVILIFALAYAAALALLTIGTFGLFGTEPHPLAGLFVVPIGFPWNMLVQAPWWAIVSPAFNLGLLILVCRRYGRR